MSRHEAIRKYLLYKGFRVMYVIDSGIVWVGYEEDEYMAIFYACNLLERYFRCNIMVVHAEIMRKVSNEL
jgi:hypothetical protein